MKTKLYLSIATLACLLCFGATTGFAASTTDLERRIEALEAKNAMGSLSDRITISGAIELDYSYDDDTSESDLSVGCVELGLEAQLHEYVTANFLLNGEDLDKDDSDGVTWDEVFFTVAKDGVPVYFTGGKRCQPFGAYESLFINDPITQELYEINATGVTLGFAQEEFMGLDLSVTAYKGTTLFGQIIDGEGAWENNPYAVATVEAKDTDEVNAYIVSASLSPMEGLNLGIFYNSEPGNKDRNTTAGAMVHFEMAGFIADAEYIGALEREKVGTKEYKENAWTVSLGYQVMEPLLVAARYEAFDGDQDKKGDLENRYSIGGTYTLFANDAFACNLLGEYRHSEKDVAAGEDDTTDEYAARLAIEF